MLAVIETEQRCGEVLGVIVQLGGQTPLKLARSLERAGIPLLGTPSDAIDLAEDRERFGALLAEEGILQPAGGMAVDHEEALTVARRLGFPVVVRPSYVLGGRAMAVCYDEATLRRYMTEAAMVSPGHPVLLDRFLEDAFELDLDLIADGERAVVAGIMQHIEEAGIHSGDSAAVLPPYRVGPFDLEQMRDIACRLARRLGVIGLMNVQFAVHEGGIYVIEVNPRASRTVPFIAKAVSSPLVRLATQVMLGTSLEALGFTEEPPVPGVFVKMPAFPFRRFPGVDPVLGPEMKSTGEVMGHGRRFGTAFAKAWLGAGHKLPDGGTAFLSVHDRDKTALLPVARRLASLGFRLIATHGTAAHLQANGLDVEPVLKVHEGPAPCGRHAARRRHPAGGQHPPRTCLPRGRRDHPQERARARHPLRHHPLGRHRHRRGDRRRAGRGHPRPPLAGPRRRGVAADTIGDMKSWAPIVICLLALVRPSHADEPAPYFTDTTRAWGVTWAHDAGRTGQFYFPEMAGPGGALFDADGDGDLDLYLVQSGRLGPDVSPADRAGDRLYLNDLRDGQPRFRDVTETSGLRANGYGTGVAVGDIEGDGDLDLYVLNHGPNQLWRNDGGSPPRFTDITATSGTAGNAWSTSAAFFDGDGDGWLDLYVVDYVDFSFDNNITCYATSSRRDYCGPQAFNPIDDHIYRHRGQPDGRFEEVTRAWLKDYHPGSGLGVVVLDAENDGDLDLYIANDGEANQLWLRQADGTYTDDALFSGVAINRAGQPEASMGMAVADPDGDGDDDLFITHLSAETNTLYINVGEALFEDRSVESGLGAPSLPYTGFGTAWLDIDGDAWLDLAVVNGAVRIQESLAARGDDYPLDQANQLFRNRGATARGLAFEDVTARGGAGFTEPRVSRGLALGDIDNDGDSDLLIIDNEAAPRLLRNDLDPTRFLGLRLVDGKRDAAFARVAITLSDGRTLWRRAATDGSYASASDPRITVALAGDVTVKALSVRWADGTAEPFSTPPINRYTDLVRGQGGKPAP